MAYRVALIADNHFIVDVDKRIYVNGTYSQQYLQRFTTNFDELIVIARGRNADTNDNLTKLRESGGNRVSFCFLQDFQGVKRYILLRSQLKKGIMQALANVDALFIRMPCVFTTIALECAKKKHIPIMLDVGADPGSIYKSSKSNMFESIISIYMMAVCRKNCMLANGVSYVTKYVLQKKYPCRATIQGESVDYFTASISNVDISNTFFYFQRTYELSGPIKLLHISNNISSNSGKGHIECIQVTKALSNSGIDVIMTFMGGGDGIDNVLRMAEKYGVKDRIKFTGRISDREKYRDILIDNHIFLFPSHSEGLPRALIEAMATGMVCVASNVDGIPELLANNDIFYYGDIQGISSRIIELIRDKGLLLSVSKRNIEVSKKYSNDILKNTYDCYYEKVRNLIDHHRKAE